MADEQRTGKAFVEHRAWAADKGLRQGRSAQSMAVSPPAFLEVDPRPREIKRLPLSFPAQLGPLVAPNFPAPVFQKLRNPETAGMSLEAGGPPETVRPSNRVTAQRMPPAAAASAGRPRGRSDACRRLQGDSDASTVRHSSGVDRPCRVAIDSATVSWPSAANDFVQSRAATISPRRPRPTCGTHSPKNVHHGSPASQGAGPPASQCFASIPRACARWLPAPGYRRHPSSDAAHLRRSPRSPATPPARTCHGRSPQHRLANFVRDRRFVQPSFRAASA